MDDQATPKNAAFDHGAYSGYAGLDPSDRGMPWLIRFARQNALLMAAIVLGAFLLSLLVLQLMPRQYIARATVVLDAVDTRVDPISGEIETANILPIQIETEVDILRSREFASRVADALDLVSDPFLNPGLSAETPVPEDALARQRDLVVTRLLNQYRLARRGESLAIDIFTLHPDPDQAARISNAVAEIAISQSTAERQARLQATVDFIDARVQALEAELASSEEELAGFIRDNELDRTTYSEELLQRIERARSLLSIERERNPGGPEVARLDAEVAELEEVLRLRTRQELQRLNMTRALETEQSRYQAFVDRRNSLETQLNVFGSPFRQITRAQAPTSAYSPNSVFVLGTGLVFGLLLAFAVAVLRSRLDRRLTTAASVEQQTAVPNLGFIPRLDLPEMDAPGVLVAHLTEVVRSPYSEAIRSLLTAVINRTGIMDCPVVAVTSAMASEGKTTLTLSLAVVAAQEMKRVLVLDLDLHRGGLTGLVSGEVTARCSLDQLTDPDALLRQILRDGVSAGVDLLAFRRGEIVPRSILTDPAYAETFTRLRREYSLVLIDTPPLRPIDEAVRLVGLADSALLVVAHDRSTSDLVASAALLLKTNRIALAGTALTGVNPDNFRRQGYMFGV
jgi:polysaccharide biosynthesis transport protein